MDVSNHFLLPTEKPCVLCPDVSVRIISGPWLCRTPQVYSRAHSVELFFLNAHLLAPLEKRMYHIHTSPEFLSAQKSIFKLLIKPITQLPTTVMARHIVSLLHFFSFVLGDIWTIHRRKKALLTVKLFEAKQFKTLYDSGLLIWDTGDQIWDTVSY
jgi:hypothetical protein